MIVDGAEVLYTMRNGKIVDPNIPTDGLICCLDTRGKYNTDIYRNTLLDLSGNGNHGTLHNFSFTEESGYVEDSPGGLKFDGVDDTMTYSHNLKETDPRTIFIDMEIEQPASEQGVTMTFPFGLFIHNANDYIYNLTHGSHFNTRSLTMSKGNHKFVVTIESTVETGKMYYLGNVYDNTPQLSVGAYHFDPKAVYRYGKRKLNRAMLWNRVLTEQEIQQLMEV